MRIHRPIVAAVAVTIVTVCTAAAATFVPGTYEAVTPGTLQPAAKGNQLIIKRAAAGTLAFGINAIRPLDNNIGSITGTLTNGTNVVWIDTGKFTRCRLHFVASGARIRLTQDTAFGDCGFGYGVLADGLYVRTGAPGNISSP